ncbi:MAG TPA: DUF411 domain-containing protein [Pyrinomonadaceae bacterium]|jgi:hypothetical protein
MKRKDTKLYFYALLMLIGASLFGGCAHGAGDRAAANRSATNAADVKASEALPAAEANNTGDEKTVTVYKSPTCGCCTMWEAHLTKAGFKVASNKTDDLPAIRKRYGVPEKAQSCHTAIVGGYFIEGHVPAADIEKLLKTRPADIAGLAAPGMPPKSPGMQPEGEKPSGYDVISFDKSGQTKVFTSY